MSVRLAYLLAAMALLFAFTLSARAGPSPEIGKPAPDFTAADINGNDVSLNALKGQKVILEWTNHQCPYVIKHYDTGNMQATQKTAGEKGAAWITLVSSAPGKQGHVSADKARAIMEEAGAMPDHKILDSSGNIGRLYDAQTTPHMFVINEEGTLVYKGAIDDKASPRHKTVEEATNYVLAALGDLEAGRPVATPVTQPYGCAVKYPH